MKKTNLRILSFILALVILSLSMPVFANDDVDNGTMDTSGEYIEDLTPIPNDNLALEDISIGNNLGGEPSVELQDFTVVTSSTVPNGVYALRNVGNGSLWMSVRANQLTAGGQMQQYNFGSSPADTFTRAGLFKITQVGTTGRYTIRFMMNNLLSIGFDESNNVVTKIIPANDEDVPLTSTFFLVYNQSGYYIRPYGSGYYICAQNTDASGAAGAPNSNLIKSSAAAMGDCARWELQKYTGSSGRGCTYSASPSISNGLTVGTKYTVTMYQWSTDAGVNTAYIDVSDEYDSIVDVTRVSDYQLMITGKRANKVRILYYIRNTAGVNIGSYSSDHLVVPYISLGVAHYIRNVGTDKYIDIEGPSKSEGAIIQQWQFNRKSQSKWAIDRTTGGYFTFRSSYSGLYIGVDSSNSSVIKQYSTQNNYTLWRFEQTSSDNYKLICKAYEYDAKVLSLPSSSSVNGVDLTRSVYSDDNDCRDEWMIYSSLYGIANYYDDSVAENQQFLQSIQDANVFTVYVYNSNFGTDFFMKGQVLSFDNVADICPTGDNSLCGDLCVDEYGNPFHHKNLNTIYDCIDTIDREDNCAYVMWMDRAAGVYCYESSGVCTPFTGLGATKIGYPIIEVLSITEYLYPSDEYESCMAITLAHEMAHCFGVADVYGSVGHTENDSYSCIMDYFKLGQTEQFYQDVLDHKYNAFCSNCLEIIGAKILENEIMEGN